ncbi:hypothetical protein [Nocardia wallacei]|nr:hypothetical protein [Nocardia wallacei]
MIDLRYSTVRGNITKAVRTAADGSAHPAPAVGKLGTVRRWLATDN